jgi:long-chain acyl-CoA synthetase
MNTIVELLESSAHKYADNPYLLEKKSVRYKATTYKETWEQTWETAAGLMTLGLKRGDRVALLCEARTDWAISELGVLYCGAISVPLSIALREGADLKFRIDLSVPTIN